jgi:hypothetical protein
MKGTKMLEHHLPEMIKRAVEEKKDTKTAGIFLVIVGLLLTPWFIGIPILGYGIYKLSQ